MDHRDRGAGRPVRELTGRGPERTVRIGHIQRPRERQRTRLRLAHRVRQPQGQGQQRRELPRGRGLVQDSCRDVPVEAEGQPGRRTGGGRRGDRSARHWHGLDRPRDCEAGQERGQRDECDEVAAVRRSREVRGREAGMSPREAVAAHRKKSLTRGVPPMHPIRRCPAVPLWRGQPSRSARVPDLAPSQDQPRGAGLPVAGQRRVPGPACVAARSPRWPG